MNTSVNIMFFYENEEDFKQENIQAEYEKNKYLKVNDSDNATVIDLQNNIFERTTNEFVLKIDFDKKLINLKSCLNNLELNEEDYNCYLKECDKFIELGYSLGNKIKIIYEFNEDK